VQRLLSPGRLLVRTAVAALLLLAVMLLCSLLGSESISLKAVFSGVPEAGATNPDYEIFMHVRLPRVVTLQALLRNPLADPYILGISSGAGLGAMLAVISGCSWTLWGRSPIAVFAFAGALGTVWLVWAVGG